MMIGINTKSNKVTVLYTYKELSKTLIQETIDHINNRDWESFCKLFGAENPALEEYKGYVERRYNKWISKRSNQAY